MDIQTYKQEAKKTLSKEWFLTLDQTTELHCAMGLVGEFGEIAVAKDNVNLMEEVGDALWFITEFQRKHSSIDWEDVELFQNVELEWLIRTGMLSAIEVNDLYKKKSFYGKPIPERKLKSELYTCYRCCLGILAIAGYTVEETRARNIQKLQDKKKGRYKDGKFSSNEAIERNTDNERDLLEGTQQ